MIRLVLALEWGGKRVQQKAVLIHFEKSRKLIHSCYIVFTFTNILFLQPCPTVTSNAKAINSSDLLLIEG